MTEDLWGDNLVGDNHGIRGLHPELTAPTAYDVKGAHALLHGWEDDDLRQIPILPRGSRLKQGATYIDLHFPSEVFTATGDMESGPENWYVPKSSVPYPLWDRLVGINAR
ncbi:MAG TPA: hypothetical protein VF221_09055 [Chloroflexota bacterium]